MAEAVKDIYSILKDQIKYAGERYTGDIGPEIETETDEEYSYPKLKFWNCVRDGSLRNFGVEYVAKSPVSLAEAMPALREFQKVNELHEFNKGSVSTSVHVHLNMLNETFLTLANILTAYALVENLMIKYSGPDRLSNLFCLPFRDAEQTVVFYTQMLSYIGRRQFGRMRLRVEDVKYSALNCEPLSRMGTIEFRSFRGETDINLIMKWFEIIIALRNYARKEGVTPITIMEDWRKKKQEIVKDIFGDLTSELTNKMVDKDVFELLQKNQTFAARFATTCKDWSTYGVVKIKPVYKAHLTNELDNISQAQFTTNFANLDWAKQLVVQEMYYRYNPNVRIVDFEGDE